MFLSFLKKETKKNVIGAKDSRLRDTKISSNEEEIVWRNEGTKKNMREVGGNAFLGGK